MSERGLRFRIGVFVLAALVLLAVLATLFGGLPDFLKGYDDYFVTFDDASGVVPGTPVRRSGIRIGEVKSVELNSKTGQVRVHLRVEKKYPLFPDDQPVLVQGLLGGDTSIDFVQPSRLPPLQPDTPVPGKTEPPAKQVPPPPDPPPNGDVEESEQDKSAERTPVKPGTEFTGVRQADLNTIFKQLSDLAGPTQETLRDVRKSLQSLDRMAPRLEEAVREFRDLGKSANEALPELRKTNAEIQVTARNWARVGERINVLLQTNEDKLVKTLDNLNDTLTRIGRVFSDENQRNLTDTLKNVRAGSQNLESLTKNTDELVKESQRTLTRINESLGRADGVLANLQEATRPLANRSDSIVRNLDDSVGRLNKVLAEVQGLLRALDQSDGTLRKFLTDPSLYNHLDEAACGVVRMLPRVDRMLKDLEVFADKLARHPEALGLGGVVRPSSGLKDPPLSPPWLRPAP
jgi:ABC-type transporter Mla subunit MlaD